MSTGASVLAVLPRGEAIRTHVWSRALDRLHERYRVHIASVRPNDDVWALLDERYASVSELHAMPERRRVRMIREALEVAHGRWLWSEAAKERWRRRDAEAGDNRWSRAKLAAKRALTRPLATSAGLRALDRIYEQASHRARPGDTAVELLRRLDPALVFNGSHVHSRNAEGLVIAAKAAVVPSAAFLFSWDNLTSQGRIVPRYDHYLAWNDAIRHDLLRIYPGTDPDAVVVTGTPQFDPHFWHELAWTRDRLCAEIGADPDRPIVLYATGMPNHMPDEPWIVEDLADRLSRRSDAQLVVRVYAKDRSGRFDALAARRPDIVFAPSYWEQNWLTPLPEDTPLWSNLLRHADVGVNVASTVSLELCMFDRPVLNVGYNPPTVPRSVIDYSRYYRFDHYRPVVDSGAVEVAANPDDLMDGIAKGLADPTGGAAPRRVLLERMFGPTLDGRSGERVARALAGLV